MKAFARALRSLALPHLAPSTIPARSFTHAPHVRPTWPSLAVQGRRWNSSTVGKQSPVQDELQESLTKKAERTMRRFWKTVAVKERDDGSFGVTLDGRNLRTPAGSYLTLPKEKRLLANLIAQEWDDQKTLLKPHTLPMASIDAQDMSKSITSLAARAIDGLNDSETREKVVNDLLRYLETDTVCFYESHPPALVRLQAQRWDPLLQWVRTTYGVEIVTFDTVLAHSQPVETMRKLREVLEAWDGWKLAAFERAVMTSKSFLTSLALVEGHLSAEDAARTTEVEVASQIERWGEVEDTHDVDYQDLRKQLGSVACFVMDH